jgi:GGDEF domain-containing protein
VASVVVGFAVAEGNLLFPDFLVFLESELRVEDRIFRLTRERALLILRDLDSLAAQSVVERLRLAFEREFPATDALGVEIRYLEVRPGPTDLSVKHVLQAVFGGDVAVD